MPDSQKRHYPVPKVEEATTDSRQLFQLVGNLLGKKEDNPLPDITSNSALAEDFASFLLDKIDNIHTTFNTIVPYKLLPREDVPIFRKFSLGKTILGMPSKTYTLDIIPTSRLKEV